MVNKSKGTRVATTKQTTQYREALLSMDLIHYIDRWKSEDRGGSISFIMAFYGGEAYVQRWIGLA